MKFLLFTIFLTSTFSTFANPMECIAKLTNNYRSDSITHSINLDDVYVREYGNDHLANGIQVIRKLLEIKGCKRRDINFSKTPIGKSTFSRCKVILEGEPNSRVCFIESSLGYFLTIFFISSIF